MKQQELSIAVFLTVMCIIFVVVNVKVILCRNKGNLQIVVRKKNPVETNSNNKLKGDNHETKKYEDKEKSNRTKSNW